MQLYRNTVFDLLFIDEESGNGWGPESIHLNPNFSRNIVIMWVIGVRKQWRDRYFDARTQLSVFGYFALLAGFMILEQER